mgnify:CR=1 FL=1
MNKTSQSLWNWAFQEKKMINPMENTTSMYHINWQQYQLQWMGREVPLFVNLHAQQELLTFLNPAIFSPVRKIIISVVQLLSLSTLNLTNQFVTNSHKVFKCETLKEKVHQLQILMKRLETVLFAPMSFINNYPTSSINIASSVHSSNTITQCSHSWPIKHSSSVPGTNFESWFLIQILRYDGSVV